MELKETLLKEFDWELATTRRFLALMPADKASFKPHEKSMELNRLVGHIAESIGWGSSVLETEKSELKMDEWKPLVPAAGADAVEALDGGAKTFRAALAQQSNESLQANWQMTYGGQTVVNEPRIDALRKFVFSHIVHHRAQLGVYYRLLGIPVPATYGPSADEQPGM